MAKKHAATAQPAAGEKFAMLVRMSEAERQQLAQVGKLLAERSGVPLSRVEVLRWLIRNGERAVKSVFKG